MAIFNSYVKLPEGIYILEDIGSLNIIGIIIAYSIAIFQGFLKLEYPQFIHLNEWDFPV